MNIIKRLIKWKPGFKSYPVPGIEEAGKEIQEKHRELFWRLRVSELEEQLKQAEEDAEYECKAKARRKKVTKDLVKMGKRKRQ
jgi:hypothetical protein